MDQQDKKVVENRLRRRAGRQGYTLIKDPRYDRPREGWMVVDARTDEIIAGGSPAFSLSIGDVEAWLETLRKAKP